MKESITVNNRLLSEHLKEEEEIELENDIKKYNNDSSENICYYRKPNAKITSKRERNGVVKMLQNEVNYRNRETLATKYLKTHEVKNAMVIWMIGCYKQEKIVTKDISDNFEIIVLEYKIQLRFKNLFAALRNYFGTIKKSSFGIEFINHIRMPTGGNYYYLTEEGYNLKPEKAIELSNVYPKSGKKAVEKFASKKEQTAHKNESIISAAMPVTKSNKEDNSICVKGDIKERFGIDLEDLIKNGLTVNIFGNIIINK